MAQPSTFPIAIIGAGPVGLAAAAHLHARKLPFIVVEAGPSVGHQMLQWGHVQMFSPWRYCVDAVAVALLEDTGWELPDPEGFPSGRALVERYLQPLAAHPALAPHLHLNQSVVAVSRAGLDKLSDTGRAEAPFVLLLRSATGDEQLLSARAVIDASGSYGNPNPLGANGLPAIGEHALADQIAYGIPDVLDAARERYAGKRVLVAGSGHSAFNAILELVALVQEVPGTQITWVVRKNVRAMERAYGGGVNDALPARGALGQRVQQLVDAGMVRLVTGWRSERLQRTATGIVVYDGQRALDPVDEIIVATGLRPDLRMLGELRLGLDSAVEAPMALAPLIDPNVHSCGTVRPHGAQELAHPEPDFYIIGMKSYGRAPTFLLLTGYEQARSVAAALAGDWEAARRVELELPETGVCSGPIAAGVGAGVNPAAVAPNPASVLIDLTPRTPPDQVVLSACCGSSEQASCCAAEDKAACCGARVGAGDAGAQPASCGCR